jgi:hypothetical protein
MRADWVPCASERALGRGACSGWSLRSARSSPPGTAASEAGTACATNGSDRVAGRQSSSCLLQAITAAKEGVKGLEFQIRVCVLTNSVFLCGKTGFHS